MGFMGEISEENGKQYAYKCVLEKLNNLEKEYTEKYTVPIPEMYAEIFDDIVEYIEGKIK